jgi:hypothetical protein
MATNRAKLRLPAQDRPEKGMISSRVLHSKGFRPACALPFAAQLESMKLSGG